MVVAGGHERLAAGAERQREDRVVVAVQNADVGVWVLSWRQIPDPHRPVGPTGCEILPVRAQYSRADLILVAAQNTWRGAGLTLGQIPEPHLVISAAADQQLPVMAKQEAGDRRRVSG